MLEVRDGARGELVGPEFFIWARRKNRDGESASDSRIQFSMKYDFGGTIYGGRR